MNIFIVAESSEYDVGFYIHGAFVTREKAVAKVEEMISIKWVDQNKNRLRLDKEDNNTWIKEDNNTWIDENDNILEIWEEELQV